MVWPTSDDKEMTHIQAKEVVTYGRSHKVRQPITIHIPQRQGIHAQIVAVDAARDGLHHLGRTRAIARNNEQLPTSG